MTWIPDSNWLKALDVKGSVAGAIAVACLAVLFISDLNWFYLGALSNWVKAVFAIVAVLALSLLGGNLAQWGIDEYKRARQRRQKERLRAEHRQQVLRYLDTLSNIEREILSYLVQTNRQSFTTDMAGDLIGTLKQKGLIEMGSGVHSALNWPFIVPNFVWEELKRRQDEFNTADLEGPVPWRERW